MGNFAFQRKSHHRCRVENTSVHTHLRDRKIRNYIINIRMNRMMPITDRDDVISFACHLPSCFVEKGVTVASCIPRLLTRNWRSFYFPTKLPKILTRLTIVKSLVRKSNTNQSVTFHQRYYNDTQSFIRQQQISDKK